MKKILPFFLIIAFLAVVDPASASVLRQATVTPTATFIPPSVTPTPYLFQCPVGTPLAWGTYTPSPLWLSTCGACDVLPTQTALATFTQNPMTATAEFLTGTPTPFITSTVEFTPTATSVPLQEFTFTNEGWAVAGIGNPYNSSSWCEPVMGNDTSLLECYGFFDGRVNAGSAVGYQLTLNAVDIPLHFYWDIQHDNPSNQDMSCALGGVGTVDCVGDLIVETGGNFALSLVADNTDSSGTNIPVTGDWTISVSSAPIVPVGPTATPTITPTAMPDYGYCSSVAPQYDAFGFDLFIPDGDPWCEMGWDEIEVTDELSIPAVQICLQPSKFGVVRIVAVDFEMGTYGLVAAAAYFLRWLRTV